MDSTLLDIILEPERYDRLGPWRNHWGYTVEIAQFQDGTIIVRYETPQGESGRAYFTDWESCERFVLLLEQDRRF
jgi:environmental stress-induced protein Ves